MWLKPSVQILIRKLIVGIEKNPHKKRVHAGIVPPMRLPGGSGQGDFTDAQVDACRRVGKALDALGGLGSPAGSCVWYVVGLQHSIRFCVMRQGWVGRHVRVE